MKNLKIARKNSNLTQKEVAEHLGIPTTTYANYEQIESSNPPIETLLKISELFECSTDYLFGKHSNIEIKKSLNNISPEKQKAIELINKLNDNQTAMLLGYLAKMTDTPLEEVLSASSSTNQNRRIN